MTDPDPLKALLAERLWTQGQLARRAKVSLRTVCNALAGRRVRHSTKRKLLKAFGLSIDQHKTVFPETPATEETSQ